MILKKLRYIITLSLLCLGLQVMAQNADTISVNSNDLPFPIPQDDGNPYNQTNQSGLYFSDPSNVTHTIEYDPVTGQYIFVSKVGDFTYRDPYTMTRDQYADFVKNQSIKNYWKDRRESTMGNSNGNSLIPPIFVGGKVFDKIFGSNTIDIKLQGSADVTFGVKYQRRHDPSLTVAQQRTTNFDFNENIQLSASAKIGEKIQFKMSYNTKTQFSFENKLTLKYEGDEDDILQLIEAGNVSMPLRSTLITGTQSLFGFKTKLKFGKTTVTAIASYQESETQNIAVNGGALTQEYELECIDYEENRHFFLSQYFRDHYEEALATLPTVTSSINITKIEVWVTNTNSNYENCRNIVAFTDLGEGKDEWIYNHNKVTPNYTPGQPYPDNSANSLLNNIDTTQIRDLNTVTSYLTGQGYTSGRDFEKIQKARKLSANEFSVNRKLGFITLNITLNSNQTLAVAFQYTVIGQDGVFQVGEFSDEGIREPDLLVTKMLKSTTINTRAPMWNLMMKNVYNIRAYQVASTNFTMDILYLGNSNGVATGYFADAPDDIKGVSLLNLMGMDRLNNQNNPIAGGDGMFDFINGAATNGGTINAATGRIYFTVLEPFGSHIRNAIFPDNPSLADKYAYDSLYTMTKVMAQQYTDKNKFRLEGRYTSSSGSEINLNALNVQPGSVKVTAGGIPLTENVDYTVDYTLGRVTILNEALLNSGTTINVSLENNTAMSAIRKTYLGARVEHEINPTFVVGGTILHLSERAYTTKVNYNDEPISNTIYGFDINYQTDSQWLTDIIDKLPLYESKTRSRITVSGEFARFIQGINKESGQTGTSYIDDFEGAKSTIDLRQWNFWHLASTPQSQSNLFPESGAVGLDYGKNRAKLAWYTIDQSVFYDRYGNLLPPNITNNELSDHRVRQVLLTEIYPKRDIQAGTSTNMSVLNLAYYPKERGPYNYDTEHVNLDGTFNNPEDRWGGIMRAIESSDFNSTNVEYIEFWLMDPFCEGQSPTNIGQLYFNLGDVSEDILRDGRKSYEHGLPTTAVVENVDTTMWGRVPSLQALVDAFNTDPASRPYQDIGYDGLNNDDERSFFQNFINTMRTKLSSDAFAKLSGDPSSDDYHYFRGSDYDEDPLYSSILERYKRYNGNEGNSPSETEYTEDYTTNNSTLPDEEDINGDNTLSESENYYQYVIEIDPNKLQTGQNHIADTRNATVQTPNGETKSVKWYQFRIPIREPNRVIGNIEGFSSIRFMRMFLKGFQDDIVLRFATLDLVRGEWRTYTNAIQAPGEYQPGDQTNHTTFEMSAVNVEENSGRYPVPYCIPPGIEQEVYTGTTSTVRQNEQALQLAVKNLVDGDARGVYKTTEFDFRFYKKLKMFVHAESMYESSPVEDNEVTAFIRFGTDLTDNYYEYEVPLKMTPWRTSVTDEYAIWPESNNFEIDFERVVNVKSNRNTAIANGNTEIRTNRLYIERDGKNSIKVLGNPTISEVRCIMIGVRNPKIDNINDDHLDKSFVVWINELRMTDLSSNGGYAATGRVEAILADLGRVIVSGSYKSAGYGSLETKITNNDMLANAYYGVSADIDAGKFMSPEKTGITVPVHFDHNKTTITPEYNPLDPDVKLKRSLEDLDKRGQDSLNQLARDVTTQTSFNITNMRKNRVGTKKPHFWDVENLNASYSYTNQEQTNPDMEYNRQKAYRGGIGYTYTSSPKPWTPFAQKKWASSKYMQLIKDFNLYYMPKSFSFNTEMNRQIQTQKMRNKSSGLILTKETVAKNWDWTRNYDFRYDITRSLNFTYNAATQAYIYEPAGNPERDSDEWKAYRDTVHDELMSFGSISQFHQTVKLNYTIPINKLPFCDWLGATASYTGNYRWMANSRMTQERLGNTLENDNAIQLTATADFTKLYNKSEYLKRITTPKRTNNNNKNNDNSRARGKKDDKSKNDSIVKKNDESASSFSLADNLMRILISIKKVSFSYSETNGLSMPGFMIEPKYFGMNNNAPGWGFVLGQKSDILNKSISNGWLSTDSTFNQPYSERYNETYNYKVNIEPFTDLKIEVTGNRTYAETFSEYFRADEMGIFQFYTPTNGGNYSISYLMTNTSFQDGDKLFDDLCNYRLPMAQRLAENNKTWVDMGMPYVDDPIGGEEYPYGYSASSQDVLTYAFLAAYTGHSPEHQSIGLFNKFALPNWTINFTGLTKIPALKKVFKTINLSHTYKSSFTISTWSANVNYDPSNQMAVYNGTNTRIPEYDISQVLLNEQYSPLLGVTLVFNNTLAPSIEYKKSRTVTLGFSNNQITEVNGREIVIGLGYTLKDLGFSIALLDGNGSKNVTNDLKLKLDIGFRKDMTTLRSIDERHSQISSGQNKINVYLTGDYNFSQRLGVQVFFKYDMTNPFIANSYKTTNIFAGLTARFSLTQ